MPTHPADIAGNYDLEKTIGKGHFAIVKLARHVFTGEMVAVKIIDKTKLDPVAREHLFQEVICMKLVQHPHVVRLYEVIDTAYKLYLIQEWGDGGDLYDYIMRHENGLPEPMAKKYFSQILSAIAYCHKLHVVHRDLKPENVVFFKKQGIVKLTDFGFSNKFTPGSHLETSCGSLAYSAPEILLGDSYDPPKVDIWSLGVILYMLVCGRLPFQEANDSETLTKIMDCHYTFPNHLGAHCEQLIRLMLCRDPSKRATLDDILAHPWFHSSQIDKGMENSSVVDENLMLPQPSHSHHIVSTCCQLPLVCQHRFSYEEHVELLNLMADGNLATQAEIQSSLDEDRYDYLTSTYFLLAERRLRRRHPIAVLPPDGPLISFPSALPTPSDSASSCSTLQQAVVVQPNVPVRVLTPESDVSGAPEDRLRRFSMILEDQEEDEDEDQEEEDEVIDSEDVHDGGTPGIIIEDDDEGEHTASNEGPYPDASYSVPLRKLSSTLEARQLSSPRERSLVLHKSVRPSFYELGEFIELNNQGVATLRYSKSSVWGSTSRGSSSRVSSVSRRHHTKMSSISHVHSMPHLLHNIVEESIFVADETAPDFQKAASTKRTLSYDVTNWPRPTAVSLRGDSEGTTATVSQSALSKHYWRVRVKRQSLPPLGTVSPSGFRRQKKKYNYRSASETSAPLSKSHSNSSESSDAENSARNQGCSGDRSILECIESNPSSNLGYNQALAHVLVMRNIRVPGGLVTNQSGSSSGINLRDNYAPIHEDVETESISTQAPMGRFHHSFSMTPTPNPSGWNVVVPYSSQHAQPVNGADGGAVVELPPQLEYERRRSDYGHMMSTRPTSGSDTPARHSVHGLSSHRCFIPLPSNGVGKSKHFSGRSMSQSNFSLSSLANSLRASKVMMEVIRGTYELQMYQQRSKPASSINSSTQQLHHIDGSKPSTNSPIKETPGDGVSPLTDSTAPHTKAHSHGIQSGNSVPPKPSEATVILSSPRENGDHLNVNNGKVTGASVVGTGRIPRPAFNHSVATSMPAFPMYYFDGVAAPQSSHYVNEAGTMRGTEEGPEAMSNKVAQMSTHSFVTSCRRTRSRRACCILS